jgi:hypothetical protein
MTPVRTMPTRPSHGGRFARPALLVASIVLVASVTPALHAAECSNTSVGFTPLTDLGKGTYHGEQGGLYPGGSNKRPSSHTAEGIDLASKRAVPRRADGKPDAKNGTLVFLSIGMSNAEAEFGEFVHLAEADQLKSPRVAVVNGAESGQEASEISDPSYRYWSIVDERLAEASVTREQVGAVWLKEAEGNAGRPFPVDAQQLEENLAEIVKILKDRFPNLWLVYLSSRIYGGYASTGVSPEPSAYQNGFGAKWVIQRQLEGSLPVGANSAPWLSWGPYMWADGTHARSDGLKWLCEDFLPDGTHPSRFGTDKVANMLLDFFHADATAKIWYRGQGQSAEQVPPSKTGATPTSGATASPTASTPSSPTPTESPSSASPVALAPQPGGGGLPATALLLLLAPAAALVAYRRLRGRPLIPRRRTPAG